MSAGTISPEGAPGPVFVTGALGFIGRGLMERCRQRGWEVRGVDRAAEPDLNVVGGDISQPGEWQRHAAGAETVIHTAAIVSLRAGLEDFHRVNVLGTHNVLRAAIDAGARRLLQLSSVTVFGNDFPDGVSESDPVRLLGVPYVDTKIAGEQVVLQAHAAGEIVVTVIRPGDVYGPRSRPWLILPLQEIKRRRVVLPAWGRGIHSPVYIDDLLDGILAACVSPSAAGEVITLSGGEGVTTRDYFGRIGAMIGRPRVPCAPTAPLVSLAGAQAWIDRLRGAPGEVNPNAIRYLTRTGTYSIAKAERLLGFAPKVTLDEGMSRGASWLRGEGML